MYRIIDIITGIIIVHHLSSFFQTELPSIGVYITIVFGATFNCQTRFVLIQSLDCFRSRYSCSTSQFELAENTLSKWYFSP